MSRASDGQRAAFFADNRPRLFSIAYRMLGSGSDADDVLQEAQLRALRAEKEPSVGWLVRVVSRLCIDELRSARRRREHYVGPWLPEPEPTPPSFDTSGLSMALMSMLERLDPRQRVAFVLFDAFDYTHAEIAEMLGVTPEHARQILRRARERIGAGPRFSPTKAEHSRMLMAFSLACQTGDAKALAELLADDVNVVSDGGGQVTAATRIVRGRERCLRFLLGLAAKATPTAIRVETINGDPALLLQVPPAPSRRRPHAHTQVICIETDGVQIHTVFAVLNPDKLSRLNG